MIDRDLVNTVLEEIEQKTSSGGSVLSEQLSEIQKLNDEIEKYRAEAASYQASAELREKRAENRGFWKGIISSIIASIIAGLVIYYWPFIETFIFVPS